LAEIKRIMAPDQLLQKVCETFMSLLDAVVWLSSQLLGRLRLGAWWFQTSWSKKVHENPISMEEKLGVMVYTSTLLR
jgi:hypothetical protein